MSKPYMPKLIYGMLILHSRIMILEHHELEDALSRVQLLKPCIYARRQCFHVQVEDGAGDGSRALVLQTPLMYMPYSPLQDDRGNLAMDLCMKCDASDAFFTALETLSAHMRKMIAKRIVDHEWLSLVREDPKRLKIRGVTAHEMEVYDHACKPLLFTKLHKEDSIRLLLHVKYIWIDTQTKTCGLKLQPLQIQKTDPPILAGCMFQPTHPRDDIIVHKMIKVGIPQEAIAHKMLLQGLRLPPKLKPTSLEPVKKQLIVPEERRQAFQPPSLDMLLKAKDQLRRSTSVVKNVC